MKATSWGVAALLGCSLCLVAHRAPAQDVAVNLARGKVATFEPAPNYEYCTDPDDKWQLTDGKYVSQVSQTTVDHTSAMWVQKGAVGWQHANPVTIRFDLGQVQPISGLSFSTAGGVSDVTFPSSILVGVSDDGTNWRPAGDLVALSNKNGVPPATGYANWRYVTHDLHQHGRYVALSVVGETYVFCDEIEIYRGDDAWVSEPETGIQFTDMRQYARANMARPGIARRLANDLRDVRAELASSELPAARRQALGAQLDALAPQCEVSAIAAIDPATFRAVVPINETDARILAVHGAILAANQPRLVVWRQHRYQWLPLLAVPPQSPAPPALSITMMKNEYRADSLLLTNAGTTALPATVEIDGAGSLAASALTVCAVPFTDTAQGTPVAAALPELAAGANGYAFSLPAGLTTKLWITVDSHLLAPGEYKMEMQVRAGAAERTVPFEVRVSQVAMATPRLSLGMWDYTNVAEYGITKANTAQAIAMMRSHFVDTPWATVNALPMAHEADFDAQNNLISPLDWKSFDSWVAKWPGSRNYFIFASVGSNEIAGTTFGMANFDARVGAWAREFSRGLAERKLRPEQVGLCLIDEPHTDAQAAAAAGWERAVKAAAPEIRIFVDPAWKRPDQLADQSAITQADILCVALPFYMQGAAPVAAYFDARQAAGQKLWIYQCVGPARLYDPTTYYRLQAWQAFEHGAVGQGFWSFSDTGGSPSSWDEYLTQNLAYAPAFLEPGSVTDAIQWDAVREGVEDYEYLSMLRDRIATATDAAWKARAGQLLNEAPAAVIGDGTPDYTWKTNSRIDFADQYRLQVLALLETAT